MVGCTTTYGGRHNTSSSFGWTLSCCLQHSSPHIITSMVSTSVLSISVLGKNILAKEKHLTCEYYYTLGSGCGGERSHIVVCLKHCHVSFRCCSLVILWQIVLVKKGIFQSCLWTSCYNGMKLLIETRSVRQKFWSRNFTFTFIFYRWSPLTVWPQAALVRHNKGLFRAIEKQNTAVPGDSHHSRFYVSCLPLFDSVLIR